MQLEGGNEISKKEGADNSNDDCQYTASLLQGSIPSNNNNKRKTQQALAASLARASPYF